MRGRPRLREPLPQSERPGTFREEDTTMTRTLLLPAGLLLLLAGPAPGEVKTKTIAYEHDGTKLKGYLAYDDAVKGKRPGVLVVHEWWGLNEFAKKRAEALAKLGYVAF